MPDCSFCGTTEQKEYPLCHSCGAIRYPVDTKGANTSASNRQQKLKLSASVAAAIITPGAFVVLAVMGANHISEKLKNQKK
ncbi:hypothetical protein [Methyloprofundus sp.]|uniref:hypothetical protein n=1 Tax=Methyloprofundus sp. TaxID=2020875 RepID=UPI003D0E718F